MVRQGIVLRLSNSQGQCGFGEIAPLTEFGSETPEQAQQFCQQLPSLIDDGAIATIPATLPACQFGFESARQALSEPASQISIHDLPLCGLLPTGALALEQWQALWQAGYRTCKWKIGVAAVPEEIRIYQELNRLLPPQVKLRLDANGGLDQRGLHRWLDACDPQRVEFLEQPLPPSQFETMLNLHRQSPVPLALDESVATLSQLQGCYQRGWRGVFVIKAAIAGSPHQLRQFLRQHQIDVVFSSVFEGAIARQAALKLAAEFSNPSRAVGYGVDHWFTDDALSTTNGDFAALWQRL
jgi:o-succinylbenzoate synthase